ncbi:phage tail assembly chaperone [Pseudomonas japonica]|uniref:phage tail assembly chaperone n=1 Tax=Pseudomonas japonica TaxID=256466 RepID=UPI003A849646
MHFYSPGKNGLYIEAVHGRNKPDDCILISPERYGQLKGQQLYVNAAGEPDIRIDVPDPAQQERAWRDGELAAVTWLRDRHRDEADMGLPNTLSAEQFTELLLYMQALRDWPASEHFPDAAQRPQPPGWLVTQTQ